MTDHDHGESELPDAALIEKEFGSPIAGNSQSQC